MTFNHEIVMAFLSKEVIEKAKQIYKSDSNVVRFEMFDVTFQLIKSNKNIVNFDFAHSYAMDSGETISLPGIGIGQQTTNIMFWNPVGYFTFKSQLFETTIEATILNQFEKEFNELRSNGQISKSIKVNGLPLIFNAIIGAFSAESSAYILTFEECTFVANGLTYYISNAEDGDPQVFLDKKYRMNGDNCVAIFSNGSLYSNADYSEIYHQLESYGIFSIQKRIG